MPHTDSNSCAAQHASTAYLAITSAVVSDHCSTSMHAHITHMSNGLMVMSWLGAMQLAVRQLLLETLDGSGDAIAMIRMMTKWRWRAAGWTA